MYKLNRVWLNITLTKSDSNSAVTHDLSSLVSPVYKLYKNVCLSQFLALFIYLLAHCELPVSYSWLWKK